MELKDIQELMKVLKKEDIAELKVRYGKVKLTLTNSENTKIVKKELINVNKDMITKDYGIYTAIWCPHCRAQYNHLQEIYDKYKENYHIVTIVAGTNTKQEVEEFMAENKYTFPIVYDDDLQLAKELEISSIPVIYENLEELDVEGLNVSDYYEKYKDEIDV